jgi:hypothetical protein
LRGLIVTNREMPIFKGFREYQTQHGFCKKNKTKFAVSL